METKKVDIEKSLQDKREAIQLRKQFEEKLEKIQPQVREYLNGIEVDVISHTDCTKESAERLIYTYLCMLTYHRLGVYNDVTRFKYKLQEMGISYKLRSK